MERIGFTATANGKSRSYVLRVPPPNVRRVGTADVLRQARIVEALRDTDVPVVDVIWSGQEERWFGSPYFLVNRLAGDCGWPKVMAALDEIGYTAREEAWMTAEVRGGDADRLRDISERMDRIAAS